MYSVIAVKSTDFDFSKQIYKGDDKASHSYHLKMGAVVTRWEVYKSCSYLRSQVGKNVSQVFIKTGGKVKLMG